MSDYRRTRPIDEPVPSIAMPRRLFVDRRVMTIPAGTTSSEAVHAVLNAIHDGERFMVRDERHPPGRTKG